MSDKPFFIGYLPVPPGLKAFVIILSGILIGGFGGAAWVLGTGQDQPEFTGGIGRHDVEGVVELTPYPVLHVTKGARGVAQGDTLLMAAGGKAGVDSRAAPLEGQLIAASGAIFERGDLRVVTPRGGRRGLSPVEDGTGEVPHPEDLGRWKLAGEICDGKCAAGAMRPGRGLAHKACANLCLVGDVPPVFVSTQPVKGEDFLLITGPDGTRLPQEAYDFVAQYISVEGQITRRGGLLVFAMDPDTLEVLP